MAALARDHSVRAISEPFQAARRRATFTPSAPLRMVFITARFHGAAEHDAALDLLAMPSATSCASTSGFADLGDCLRRTSATRHAHHLRHLAAGRRSMSSPFLPITTPGGRC